MSVQHLLHPHVAGSEFILVPHAICPIPGDACGVAFFNCCAMSLPGLACTLPFLWESTPFQCPTITGVGKSRCASMVSPHRCPGGSIPRTVLRSALVTCFQLQCTAQDTHPQAPRTPASPTRGQSIRKFFPLGYELPWNNIVHTGPGGWPLLVPARHVTVSQSALQKHASPSDTPIHLAQTPKTQNNALSTNNHVLKNKQKEHGWVLSQYFPLPGNVR